MTIVVPPAPIDAPFTSSNWVDWYEKVRRVINSAAPVDLGSAQVSGVLPIVHGGTGTAVPALNPGTNIAITGTWPFNTIAFTGILAIANGGSGSATPAIVAGTGISLSGSWPNQTVGVTPNKYVLVAGDTMTGNLGVGAAPTFGIHATGAGVGAVIAVTGSGGGGTTFMQANGAVDGRIGTLTALPLQLVTNSSPVVTIDTSGNVAALGGITTGSTTLHTTTAALTNGAGAAVGTLNNAPAAGNPTKWISINDNGTVRKIPCW